MARTIPLTDLVFLWVDRQEAPANVGIVLLFEPPHGVSAQKAAREVVRAYRASRPTVPFNVVPLGPAIGIPQWHEPERIDMRLHVRRETLPPPGTEAQLNERLAELHRDRLDRSRPLFEIHLIDGLESGRFALYVKSHHVSWDGRSALARIFGTLATRPGPLLPGFHAAPPAPPPPGSAEHGGNLHTLLSQAHAMRELYAAVSRRLAELRPGANHVRGNVPFGGPHTRLNRPVVAERTFGQFSLPLEEMRRVGKSFGGTINDVLLAVLDAGVQRYLQELGERPDGPLVVMCPVSIRDPGDHETGTKAATLFVPLGHPRSAATRRLQEVVANTSRAKGEFHAISKEAALDFAVIAFGLSLASQAFGLAAALPPVINFVVSNVGGIEGPRYLGRSRLVGAYPLSMLADPVGLNFTSVSSDGRMDIGVIASRAAVPDTEPIIRHCLAAWRQLVRARAPQDLTLRKPPARKRSRTRRIPATQRS